MKKKINPDSALQDEVLAAPVQPPKSRLEIQREVQDQALELLEGAIRDLTRDRLKYPEFEERASSFISSLPTWQQTIALRAIDGAVGRLISAAPRVVGAFSSGERMHE